MHMIIRTSTTVGIIVGSYDMPTKIESEGAGIRTKPMLHLESQFLMYDIWVFLVFLSRYPHLLECIQPC